MAHLSYTLFYPLAILLVGFLVATPGMSQTSIDDSDQCHILYINSLRKHAHRAVPVTGRVTLPSLIAPKKILEGLLSITNSDMLPTHALALQIPKILANRHSIPSFIISMRSQLTSKLLPTADSQPKADVIALDKWSKDKERQPKKLSRIAGALKKRQTSWIKLCDTMTGRMDILLPSMDIQRICQHTYNIPRIMRRFSGTVAYAMLLSAQNALDLLELPEGTRIEDSLVMTLEEIHLQLLCLQHAMAQVKRTVLENEPYPRGSILDLAERTTIEALKHMGESTIGSQALYADGLWMEDERNYPTDYFYNRFEMLRAVRKGSWGAVWRHDNYREILQISHFLGLAFDDLYWSPTVFPSSHDVRRVLLRSDDTSGSWDGYTVHKHKKRRTSSISIDRRMSTEMD